jgi:hypothetical protein
MTALEQVSSQVSHGYCELWWPVIPLGRPRASRPQRYGSRIGESSAGARRGGGLDCREPARGRRPVVVVVARRPRTVATGGPACRIVRQGNHVRSRPVPACAIEHYLYMLSIDAYRWEKACGCGQEEWHVQTGSSAVWRGARDGDGQEVSSGELAPLVERLHTFKGVQSLTVPHCVERRPRAGARGQAARS